MPQAKKIAPLHERVKRVAQGTSHYDWKNSSGRRVMKDPRFKNTRTAEVATHPAILQGRGYKQAATEISAELEEERLLERLRKMTLPELEAEYRKLGRGGF